MYYRYKIKKKNGNAVKLLLIIVLLSTTGYLGYKNRQYITFWKYSYNKLFEKINRANRIKDRQKKREVLLQLTDEFEIYKNENKVNPEGFFLAGKVHYLLGKTYLRGSFSELFINDRLNIVNKKAGKEFIKAIINIRKGSALADGQELDNDSSLILAWACFYTKYVNIGEIYNYIYKIEERKAFKEVEDIRFYSLVNILLNKIDYGLEFLQKYGSVDEGIRGKLYLASSQMLAKRYTDSIMNYKDIIIRTTDKKLLKLINFNLGKIYYNQSLFKESLAHFNTGLKIDERDIYIKIWIGKNYSALGDNDRARSIWSEVLATDEKNSEARELLGVM